jgi:hypothetical protein
MSSANDNISVAEDPPGSPSPPSEDGFVEVTGVLFNTAFSGTFDFAPEWSLSQIAHNLHGRISENAQQVFELASPLGLRGMDVFKCMSHITLLPRSSLSHIFSAATNPDLQKPINELQTNNDLDAKYLIVFDPPSDKTNFVETYIRTNKENLATARGDRLIRDEETLKAKEGKKQKQIRTSKCMHLFLAYCTSSPTVGHVEVNPFDIRRGAVVPVAGPSNVTEVQGRI